MASRAQIGPCHSQTQLEWHIEPRRAGRVMVQLDTREIMDGKPAALDQRDDAIQPPLAATDSEGDAWFKS
jgi:hypothetical protein